MIVRTLGLGAASVFAFTLVFGTAALIATDFVGVDGMKAALQTPAAPAAAATVRLGQQLDGVANLTFFAKAAVPGTPYMVQTGSVYASIGSFLAGSPERQWCYLNRKEQDAVVVNRVDLATRNGPAAPAFVSASQIPADVAALFGMSPEELAALGPAYCRFGAAPRERAGE